MGCSSERLLVSRILTRFICRVTLCCQLDHESWPSFHSVPDLTSFREVIRYYWIIKIDRGRGSKTCECGWCAMEVSCQIAEVAEDWWGHSWQKVVLGIAFHMTDDPSTKRLPPSLILTSWYSMAWWSSLELLFNEWWQSSCFLEHVEPCEPDFGCEGML